MWATSNSQTQIVRLLLDHGASPAVKTETGRTALDFVGNDDPNREIERYLRRSNGSDIGHVGVGDDWYDRGIGGEIEEQFAESEPAPTTLDSLTDREQEILALLARGRSNAEIAAELVVSETTVKTHVSSVLRKLGVRDRTRAVLKALEAGLLDLRTHHYLGRDRAEKGTRNARCNRTGCTGW